MIDLYYWPTPNGWKATIMLAECGLDYRLRAVDISAGAQFSPDFLAVNPNSKIPAIVDHDSQSGPFSLFESGAILIYLAEKSGLCLPRDAQRKAEVLQWLFWQVGGLGPMAGQYGHFKLFAAEKIPSAVERFGKEYHRLLAVMDRQLRDRDFLAVDYSIADIACWPWVHIADRLGETLDEFPHLQRWHARIAERPAVIAGLAVTPDI